MTTSDKPQPDDNTKVLASDDLQITVQLSAARPPDLGSAVAPGENDRMLPRALGADVSHWHPIKDAAALAGAVSFVGIKVSEGTANIDPTFASNLAAAREQTFELVILYHLARPGDGATQAARFLRLCGELRSNERLALDTERTSLVSVRFLQAFFAELPADRRPILYTSAGLWAGMRNPAFPEATDVDLWLPRYGSQADPQVPGPWFQIGRSWSFWQNSQGGAVAGIDGACDMNVFNGSVDQLRTYAALKKAEAPELLA